MPEEAVGNGKLVDVCRLISIIGLPPRVCRSTLRTILPPAKRSVLRPMVSMALL